LKAELYEQQHPEGLLQLSQLLSTPLLTQGKVVPSLLEAEQLEQQQLQGLSQLFQLL
jgi:hypothetical protein